MSSNRQKALAKIQSLKSTHFNAIAELELRAEQAADRDEDVLSGRLSLQAVALAKEAIRIRKAEDQIRVTMPLSPVVAQLDALAADGRSALARLKNVSNALGTAAQLIGIFQRIAVPLF